jgi:hypothetical protein
MNVMIRMRYLASLAPMRILLDTRVLGIGEKCRGSAGHLIVDSIRMLSLLFILFDLLWLYFESVS